MKISLWAICSFCLWSTWVASHLPNSAWQNPTKRSLTPESDLPREGRDLTICVMCFTIKTLRWSMITKDNIVSTELGWLKHFLWVLHHPSDWKDVHRDVQVGYSRFSHRQSGLLGLGSRTANTPAWPAQPLSDKKLSRNLAIRIIQPHLTPGVSGVYEVWSCQIGIRGTGPHTVMIMT